MTLKELQYIVTIAEEKSISRASARLYVSQPYLSQCLMRIERQHDMPLFRRTQHGLVLTFAGEQYVETARKIVKLYNDFETGLCEISNMRKGRLTIGTTIHLGSMVFSTILPIFRELYPNIELRLEEGPSQKIEEYIIASKVDIGLLHCPLKDSAISYIPIRENNFVAVLHKDSHLEEFFYKRGESLSIYRSEAFFGREICPGISLPEGEADSGSDIGGGGNPASLLSEYQQCADSHVPVGCRTGRLVHAGKLYISV